MKGGRVSKKNGPLPAQWTASLIFCWLDGFHARHVTTQLFTNELNRVIAISEGRVVQDGDKDKVLTTELLSRLFRIRLEVVRRDGYYHCWQS